MAAWAWWWLVGIVATQIYRRQAVFNVFNNYSTVLIFFSEEASEL